MKPRICAVITENNPRLLEEAEPFADLLEVRIDLIGADWPELVKNVTKPWIACNRHANEGGRWRGSEADRITSLLRAVGMGASIVDIELRTPNLPDIIKQHKGKAECIVSYHDLDATPDPDKMKRLLKKERDSGADICKLVTTARSVQDSLDILKMNSALPVRTVAFAMGPLGIASRILCPLAGGDFTYASVVGGKESAPGQLTVEELRTVYSAIKYDG